MALSLGVDTGGTYTDAVLIEDEKTVIAAAKSLTTRHDLAEGIGKAAQAVFDEAGVAPSDVTLASLSTTLATNALIEGQGERVGLVLIGFDEKDMARNGLADAIGDDPHVLIAGGHDYAGNEAATLDEEALSLWLETYGDDVSGFAVGAQFATRNTGHERRVQEIIQTRTGKPVSCSHHLSAKLGGPKRALTAVLNARLIGMISRLITRAQVRLEELGVDAPLMVVRGDGALISAEFALERPIETILSGPAASIVGARWMTGAVEALVSDIGGTTTDVALLKDGRPAIDPEGARVGPYRTMVEAVAMRTTGLGGDSETHLVSGGLKGKITLGPRRVLPVSLIATEAPDLVHETLKAQLNSSYVSEHFARFVRPVKGALRTGLSAREAGLLERIGDDIHALGNVLSTRLEYMSLKRLIERGLVQVSGITPSDASHVLGLNDAWDREASEMALRLFAMQRTGAGKRLASTAEEMARMIVDQLTHQTAVALLESAFAQEENGFDLPAEDLARHVLTQRGLSGHRGLLRIDAGLNLPVVGLGASAPTYYPAVGDRLGSEMKLPRHAHVANAIGAVVGRITIRHTASVTSPSEGKFRAHLDEGPEDFTSAEDAMKRVEEVLLAVAKAEAEVAGAEGIHTQVHRNIRTATIDGREVFLDADVVGEASGRPRIAS
ncbi:hydantoinase/oxoprolinase family protein [Aliiroseovarius sp. KMU-50]|uniref:Hydantoinase/oxoprolinase family protein n=1 Tax=Aliiroseovarius salicola TaxID=3009082 RepID=A0ABT4W496_9RHOB|nr:hydantoinase/oxoprolinase family protein [Aliiroseovarius sp. KMU-50]MDA5095319.1 hydantoinase/oxoprolinase family protein [Aliiroseovarius sp. KMU-50]